MLAGNFPVRKRSTARVSLDLRVYFVTKGSSHATLNYSLASVGEAGTLVSLFVWIIALVLCLLGQSRSAPCFVTVYGPVTLVFTPIVLKAFREVRLACDRSRIRK